jgi:hypothetical protein
MAINITSDYTNPQYATLQKYQNVYKKPEMQHKAAISANQPHKDIENVRDINTNDIREFLTNDEKRVLKEVFGDLNVDKNTTTPYNDTRYADMLKGSQIDIRL